LENIFSYYDYRKFLDDFYREKKLKDSFFSLRYMSRKIGIDHGLIVKILQGQRHISAPKIPAFVGLLELDKHKAGYFELLVLYGKATTDREIKNYFEKILAFSEVSSRRVDVDKYEFYRRWYYTAVREIINIQPFKGNFTWLGRMLEPQITTAEARKAVRLLERLAFIKKNDQGIYQQTVKFITTDDTWRSIAISTFQKEALALAGAALESIPKEERDISTVTMTLDDDGFIKARDRIRLLQKELINIASTCGRVNRVYQVNLAFFPLSKKIKDIDPEPRI
jgi:uncharacterized protein (TIGR02147 family)